MMRLLKLAIAVSAVALGTPAAAQTGNGDSLLIQDRRLAVVAERMLAASNNLCRSHMPLTGLVINSRDQYPGDVAASVFANGPVAISLVLPGSAAAAAGLRPGDGLLAVGQLPTAEMHAAEDAPLRDAVFEALADVPVGEPMRLTIERDSVQRSVALDGTAGCRALVEIRSDGDLNARSDGRVIQVDYGLAERASDEQLAVVFAHELAHLVLEHRRRLSEAGIAKGFFGEFGRNQQVNRQVEVEADRLSVHLLANAGYDPESAPAFWRSRLGQQAGNSLLRSSTYPSPEVRAQVIEREIADYLTVDGPSWPGHLLARRDVAF